MIEKAKELIKTVKNPNTGKSLVEENRLTQLSMENDHLVIKYNREGISPEDKRKIESDILAIMKPLIEEDKISVVTYSQNSSDVYKAAGSPKAAAPQASAELKVGHGTVGNKRSIPNVKKVLAVASGKGGVGKSTFTVNLALALRNAGKKVGIIDADVYGPSIPMLLGKREERPRANSEKKIIPIDAFGISFISFGLFIGENEPVIWRGPMLGGVLNQFLFDVLWDDLDYLILDLPPGTGDIQLSMVQNVIVDGAIIISTPQDVALLDATKGLQMFTKLNLPIIGMVENMSSFICDTCHTEHFIFGKEGVEKAVEKLGVNFLGSIPIEIALREGSDTGHPYLADSKNENKPVWKVYSEIASKVDQFFLPQQPIPEKKENLWNKLFK